MTNSEARKRAQEAAGAAENSISRPAGSESTNSPSAALAGAQGVEAIRARAEGAVTGPWEFRPRRGFQSMSDNPATIGFTDEAGYFVMLREGTWATEADMAFIAHARTDIPLLLAALDEARAEVAHWKQRLHARYTELDEANGRCDRLESLADKHFARAEKAEAEQAYTYGLARKAHARAAAAEAVVASVREWARTYARQWVPNWNPDTFTFDMGVGAAAHDVLALLPKDAS